MFSRQTLQLYKLFKKLWIGAEILIFTTRIYYEKQLLLI